MNKSEKSSLKPPARRTLSLLLAGGMLACLFAVATDSPERASAMEIDCSSIGGPAGLPGYVESYGVKCSGGGGGGGTSTGGGGGAGGCTLNTDKVPEGFFEVFDKGVDDVITDTSYRGANALTHLKFYRTDVDGKSYLGGVISVWKGPAGSGISLYNGMFNRGGVGGWDQTAYFDSTMPCGAGYDYFLTEHPAPGTSSATPTPLVAPGLTAVADGPVMARGVLTQLPATPGKYLLRVDVTNTFTSLATPVGLSLIMNEFDVESVVASTGGVECAPTVSRIQECSIAEMPGHSTQSLTLLLDAHADAPTNAAIPVALTYMQVPTPRNGRQAAGHWFYSATRPAPVVIDPVPTPPYCTAAEPGVENIVAGVSSSLTTTCLNDLPMAVMADHGTASIDAHGTLSYTPDAAYRGTDTLSVTASNSHGRVSAPTAVEVTVVDPPHAEADSFTARAGTTLVSTVSVLENDSINGGKALPLPIGWSAQQTATSSEHGRVILSPDGTFSYTPEHGFSGLDTFEYQLEGRNSAVSNKVTVTLQVLVP